MLQRFCLQLHGTLPVEAYPRLAMRAEALGLEDVTLHDLLMRRPVWPVLCDVARATRRVLVGPNVTHPHLQHPAVIAANLAHLDEVSGGRAVLGIGRGSLYGLVGQDDPSSLQALEEAVRVIRMLVTGDRSTFRGEVFALAEGQGLVFGRARDIPVYLGTLGPAGARLAGRIADGVRAAGQWDPGFLSLLRCWIDEGAEVAGRDPDAVDLVAENWTYLGPDREAARTGARRLLATFLPHLGRMLAHYGIAQSEVEAAKAVSIHGRDEALAGISDATVDRFMAAGDASDLRQGLDRLEQAGCAAVSFSGSLGPDTAMALEMIGAEVARRSGRTPDGP